MASLYGMIGLAAIIWLAKSFCLILTHLSLFTAVIAGDLSFSRMNLPHQQTGLPPVAETTPALRNVFYLIWP